MKKRIVIFAVLSLALGIVLTAMFAYKKTDWHQYGDCATTINNKLPQEIRRVDCSGLAYGFPYTFVQAEPRMDISYLTEPYKSPLMLGISSKTGFDTGKLLLNIAIWSALGGALIGTSQYWLESRVNKKLAQPKSENS